LKALLLSFELMVGGAVGVGVSNLRSTRRLGSFGGFSSMFSRFARPDTARSHDDGGADLGLALSAAIARAHAGTLELVGSSAVGSTFRLHLP
jgi:hypothetical protein